MRLVARSHSVIVNAMSQLERIGQMMREKRLEQAGKEAERLALEILNSVGPDFDPREVAKLISEAVKDIIDKPVPKGF